MGNLPGKPSLGSLAIHAVVLLGGLAASMYGPAADQTVALVVVGVGAVGMINHATLQGFLAILDKKAIPSNGSPVA